MTSAPPTERERLDHLQRLLLPAALPTIACTEAAAAYRASNHQLALGGDWFDLIDRPESDTVVGVIGDVVGHGVEQISAMGQLRAACAALAHVTARPDDILAGLDRFAHTVPGAPNASVAVVVLDGTDRAHIASAGHVPPIRIERDGSTHLIEGGRRPPLSRGRPGSDGVFDLNTHDLLVLYTDGVVERPGGTIDDGITQLARFLVEHRTESCKEIADAIVDVFGVEAQDDQAVLVLRPIHNRADGTHIGRQDPEPVSFERQDRAEP